VHHQLIVLRGAQQLVDQDEGQLDLVGDVAARRITPGEQELQNQGLNLAVGQIGLAERLRLNRQEGVLQVLTFPLRIRLPGSLGRVTFRLVAKLVDPLDQRVELLVLLLVLPVMVRLRSGHRRPKIGSVGLTAVSGQTCQQVVLGCFSHQQLAVNKGVD
jgi:hypothetical protein